LPVTDAHGQLINILGIKLGEGKYKPLPSPEPSPPEWSDSGKKIMIEGKNFAMIFDREKADFDADNPKHKVPITEYPALHLTRFDFADLAPSMPPYAELPDPETHVVDEITVKERADGLEITIQDHYHEFTGFVRWLIDQNGMGRISYEYKYSGEELNVREIGIRLLLKPEYDEVRWRRWSEWDAFPSDHISRTEGIASAQRSKEWKDAPEGTKPDWSWHLDQTEFGTNDFRAIKFNIYEASLLSSDGKGVRIHADADVHFRPCLDQQGVKMHILSNCRLGPVVLKPGDSIVGEYIVEIIH